MSFDLQPVHKRLLSFCHYAHHRSIAEFTLGGRELPPQATSGYPVRVAEPCHEDHKFPFPRIENNWISRLQATTQSTRTCGRHKVIIHVSPVRREIIYRRVDFRSQLCIGRRALAAAMRELEP
jgi:hypothetical protein